MKTIATIYLLVFSLMYRSAAAASIAYFSDIKLTPENAIDPFVGAEFTYGLAQVSIEYNATRSAKWRVCITTHIEGFVPGLLHIHNGEIFENGDAVVDFSALLSDHHYGFHACRGISHDLYDQMIAQPEKYYVNAQVGHEDPAAFSMLSIRGQLVQKFTADLMGSNNVAPFKAPKNTAGEATISVEAAGTVVCFDASFFKASKTSSVPASSLLVAQIHMGTKGETGDLVMDFSPTRVSSERFFGCRTLKELGIVGVQVIADLLADPTDYYVDAHVGKSGTSNFNVALRGQLQYYKL